MTESNGNKPDLFFRQTSQMEGFTSAGVQGFNDLKPAVVVRELIQNSLDAVRGTGRTKTTVRFELEKVSRASVPAIESYRKAVESAERDQKKYYDEFPDHAKPVLGAINRCLKEDQIEVLSVLDNGVGLNEQRMNGLLGDGMSINAGTSSGAFGNGHLTAIPASNLRYVLYGGVSDGGQKIASGHTILASFFDEQGDVMGKDGYYVRSVNSKSMKNRYNFPSGNDIAPLIREKLDWIAEESDSGSGAAVIIPGFNRFREKANLWDVIKKAAACNFFVAITDDELEISYQDHIDGNGETETLNKSNIKEIFNEEFDTQRNRNRNRLGFLTVWGASEAYKTATEGREKKVDIKGEKVELRIREMESGSSCIDLCRNGMWITNRLPSSLKMDKFRNHKPFHCLIKVTSQDRKIHSLIRKSEGPLHNSIDGASKWINTDDQSQFYNAFDLIAKDLKGELEEVESDTFHVRGALSVRSAKGMDSGYSFEEVPPRRFRTLPDNTKDKDNDDTDSVHEGGGEGGGGRGTKTVNTFKGNSIHFEAVPVPTGLRSYNVELHPSEKLSAGSGALIWFILKESFDETSDSPNEQRVKLKAVKLNGESVSKNNLLKGSDGGTEGVSLGQFKKGDILSFDYDLPNGVDVSATDRVVLSAKMISRRNQS